jgi:hypothetical protein
MTAKKLDKDALWARAGRGDQKALARLRPLYSPEEWQNFGDLAKHTQRALINLVTGNGKQLVGVEAVEQKISAIKAELQGPEPSPLEVLLVDCIIANWLQLSYAEESVAQHQRDGGISFRQADYDQHRLSACQRRYLASIKTLAQVRRLLGPSIQVNIT